MQDYFTRSHFGLRVLEWRKEYNVISVVNFPFVLVNVCWELNEKIGSVMSFSCPLPITSISHFSSEIDLFILLISYPCGGVNYMTFWIYHEGDLLRPALTCPLTPSFSTISRHSSNRSTSRIPTFPTHLPTGHLLSVFLTVRQLTFPYVCSLQLHLLVSCSRCCPSKPNHRTSNHFFMCSRAASYVSASDLHCDKNLKRVSPPRDEQHMRNSS